MRCASWIAMGTAPTSAVIAGVDWVTANHVEARGGEHEPRRRRVGGARRCDSQFHRGWRDVRARRGKQRCRRVRVFAVARGRRRSSSARHHPTMRERRSPTTARASICSLPASSILSAYNGSDTARDGDDGTSMAAPHVAGAAALYLQMNPGASPNDVAAALVDNATSDVVGNAGSGSANRLLYTAFIGGSETRRRRTSRLSRGSRSRVPDSRARSTARRPPTTSASSGTRGTSASFPSRQPRARSSRPYTRTPGRARSR